MHTKRFHSAQTNSAVQVLPFFAGSRGASSTAFEALLSGAFERGTKVLTAARDRRGRCGQWTRSPSWWIKGFYKSNKRKAIIAPNRAAR
jgi:hypothetical protein